MPTVLPDPLRHGERAAQRGAVSAGQRGFLPQALPQVLSQLIAVPAASTRSAIR